MKLENLKIKECEVKMQTKMHLEGLMTQSVL